MKTEKCGSRSIVFTTSLTDWNLNLHVITGKYRNYVIDTGLGSESMIPILEYLKGDPKPIIVVNTHHHWDHVWGNDCFHDTTIISHPLCRKLMADKWTEMLEKNGRFVRGDTTRCLPNLVFEGELYFPDDRIRLFYTPGHSGDGISVFDEVDGVLNAGDNIGDNMNEIVPELQADISLFIKSLHACQALPVNACISGHNIILGREIFGQIEQELASKNRN